MNGQQGLALALAWGKVQTCQCVSNLPSFYLWRWTFSLPCLTIIPIRGHRISQTSIFLPHHGARMNVWMCKNKEKVISPKHENKQRRNISRFYHAQLKHENFQQQQPSLYSNKWSGQHEIFHDMKLKPTLVVHQS